jgi:DnaJ homolog subfamily C member 9
MARKVKVKEEALEDLPPAIDPYKTLEIDEKATADQVKSAYRKQALKHHPGKCIPALCVAGRQI